MVGKMVKTPDEINMNEENAFLLREAAKSACAGYYDHLSAGGKGDPAEERWIEALIAGADALAYIQQLEAERDALLNIIKHEATFFSPIPLPCRCCKNIDGAFTSDVCRSCAMQGGYSGFEWCGVKEEGA